MTLGQRIAAVRKFIELDISASKIDYRAQWEPHRQQANEALAHLTEIEMSLSAREWGVRHVRSGQVLRCSESDARKTTDKVSGMKLVSRCATGPWESAE